MYKIMIIDDEIDTRIEYLEGFFKNIPLKENKKLDSVIKKSYEMIVATEFEICYPSENDLLVEYIKKNKVDAYFLDVFYFGVEEWTLGGVLGNIETYNPDAPIFMYSVDWDTKPVLEKITQAFRNHFSGKTATYFYDLNDIIKMVNGFKEAVNRKQVETIGRERRFIKEMIDRAYGRTVKNPFSEKGDVTILHISDIQYGDKSTTRYAENIWNEVNRICKELKKKDKIAGIDLLAVTGDVTMHGKSEEMKTAQEDMECLFKKLWPDEYESKEYQERILIVPGNHDFDLNFCAMDYFNARNGTGDKDRQIDFKQIAEDISTDKRSKQNDYHVLGLAAYKDFVFEISGNPIVHKVSYLNYVDDRFVNWNLRFICLNTCDGICAEKTNGVKINQDELRSIIRSDNEEEYYTIALSHHTPLIEDSLNEEEKEEFRVGYNSIIHTCRAKVWLGGHRHIHDKDDRRNCMDTCMIYESATIRLEEDWGNPAAYTVNTEKAGKIVSHRGFQIIILRKDGNAFEPQILRYVFNKEGIALKVAD